MPPSPIQAVTNFSALLSTATIFEMNVESYRARKARERKRATGKSAASDNQSGT
jgi:hypothetical protein